MTKKECKILAKQIAEEEKKIRKLKDKKAIQAAEQRIQILIFSIPNLSFEDIAILDEMVQDILS